MMVRFYCLLRRSSNWLCLICFVLLFGLPGCQPFTGKKSMVPWGKRKEDPKVLPDHILAVWTDTVLHQPSQKGIRGFGGRVYFYEKDKPDPIEVHGSLAIYVFDAEDESVDTQKPLRKFAFTTDQLASHMSKTSIGPSYSLWLPWSEVGGQPMKLSLITRFEGEEGGTTISDPVIKLLPGISKKLDAVNPTKSLLPIPQDQGVQQASYSESKDVIAKPVIPSRAIDTIELPPGFQRHLMGVESKHATALDPTPERFTEILDARSRQSKKHSDESRPIEISKEPASEEDAANVKKTKEDRIDLREGKWIQSDRLEDRLRQYRNR